jgi:ribonuclease R
MVDLTEEILSLHKDSPITTQLQRQLPRSKYISSNEYSSTERRHFALDTDCYTHFTSPIRRYFDIVVHRVLFSETTAPIYDDHEMEVS